MSAMVGRLAEVESRMRGLRCPCCNGQWCRCQVCGARYALGEAVACAMPAHATTAPIGCRCGAVVDGPDTVRTPHDRQLALIGAPEPPLRSGFIARLRPRDNARIRLGTLVRAARRAALGIPHRETPTPA